MITLIACSIALLLGYYIYSKIIAKILNIDSKNTTPAYAQGDGVDFVPISKKKNALINLLNIAGTGPVFGPILGALYGPVSLIWIVVGCIFAGAVHDFIIGIVSLRNKGSTLPILASKYIGKPFKHIVNLFSALLLILVATVFVVAPANLIYGLTDLLAIPYIIAILFGYYLLSTIMPVDKIIGKIYPFFGALLILSALGILISIIFFAENKLPEISFSNMHPQGMPIFPLLFLVLSCGALSGFHATQIPIVTRTLQNENQARFVFYGMMIAEGFVAMIWAYATITLLDGQTLLELIKEGTPSLVVNKIAIMSFGAFFGTFVILGVIILPVTSGATAFRGIRLMLAEYMGLDQKPISKRLFIAIPCFIVAIILCFIDFQLLWQYFSWANQTLATISLWISTMYLIKTKRNMWVAFIPALFITFVVITYILYAPIGFRIDLDVAKIISAIIVIVLFISTVLFNNKHQKIKKESI